MQFHEAANIFPLDDEHLDELAEDIKQHGLQIPIEQMDGKIIDGRRRWLACEKAGVRPDIIPVSVEDPIAYVMSLNLHRRHLTVSQAAMCAQRARKMYDDAAKERQKAAGGDRKSNGAKSLQDNCPEAISKGQARDQVGETFGVSGKSVDRAAKVIKDGIPEIAEAVDSNEITIFKASQIVANPPELQKPLLDAALASKNKVSSPKSEPANHKQEKPSKRKDGLVGVGIIRANEAINCLSKIPKNDALRKRGFQLVSDWVKANK